MEEMDIRGGLYSTTPLPPNHRSNFLGEKYISLSWSVTEFFGVGTSEAGNRISGFLTMRPLGEFGRARNGYTRSSSSLFPANYLQTQQVITTTLESCQVKRVFTDGFCLVYSQFTPALTLFSVKLKPRKMETSLKSCSQVASRGLEQRTFDPLWCFSWHLPESQVYSVFLNVSLC